MPDNRYPTAGGAMSIQELIARLIESGGRRQLLRRHRGAEVRQVVYDSLVAEPQVTSAVATVSIRSVRLRAHTPHHTSGVASPAWLFARSLRTLSMRCFKTRL
jgi:hypothetical protein